MKNLLVAFSSFFFVSGVARAQFSITPRVSHSNYNLKFEQKVTDETTKVETSSRVYSNSVRYAIEAGYKVNESSEVVFNIGEAGYYKISDTTAYFMSYDLAYRHYFGDFYGQVGLGAHTLKYDQHDSEPSGNFTLPTASLGLGYLWKFTDKLALDVFYRGFRAIHESEADRSKDELFTYDNTLSDLENHELGAGVRYQF